METVPVRGMPSERTCIGTVRVLFGLFRVVDAPIVAGLIVTRVTVAWLA